MTLHCKTKKYSCDCLLFSLTLNTLHYKLHLRSLLLEFWLLGNCLTIYEQLNL